MIQKVDDKNWKAGFLEFYDLGKIEGGVTHKYDVRSKDGQDEFTDVLGHIIWKSGWRKYIFRTPGDRQIDLDESCLTIIADFARMQTDERKSGWSKQGRFQ